MGGGRAVSPWVWPLVAWALLAAAMAALWVWQLRTRDAGWVDAAWSAGIGAAVTGYALAAGGWGPRRGLVAALVLLWSVRLTTHLVRRLASAAEEDGRYAALRAEAGARWPRWSFVFFQAQALLAAALSAATLPALVAAEAGWRAWDLLGAGVFLAGLVGEGIADRQLAAWRRDPANRGRTCRAGLWRVSRHPNYFFEWWIWIGLALLATGLPYGGFAWLAPAAMLLLVLKVTGIPPTERRALETRGADYRRYQATTNAFFPGPVRSLEERGGTA